MSPATIIKQLDVFKDSLPGLRPAGIVFVMNSFGFQTVKKTFRHRIIPAVAFPAHAANHAVFLQHTLILVGSILGALIGMHQKAPTGLPASDGHLQGFTDQLAFNPLGH